MLDYRRIEEKWQKAWADAKIFEAEPDERKPLLVTAAWPYVNMPQHMGHFRTYGTADTYARYMRMKGYNVLFPMGFHKTGTPVLAIAKRVAAKEKDVLDELANTYHVPNSDIEKMVDPFYIADYFSNEIEAGLRAVGMSMDWRRKFSSIDPLFSRMVEWQFRKLKRKGLLTQGSHPVGWCPNENNAVGQHDTKGDVQPAIEKLIAIKFKDKGSGACFPCVTYRPETVYGVTNLFINTSLAYVEAEVDGASFYMAKAAASCLSSQFSVKIKRDVGAAELLGKKAVNPINGSEIQILDGYFVRDDFGTGVVMSVPAHAPFDYVALERLRKGGAANVPAEPYPVVLKMDSTDGGLPAMVYLQSSGWGSSSGDDIIERATKLVYREESRSGRMVIGEFAGLDEPAARKLIWEKLKKENNAFDLYLLTNELPVICRCGARVVVNIVRNQWFINYGDETWKKTVKTHMKGMKLYPGKLRHTYEGVVDWIEERAAERAQGLGTRFPFNQEHIIESLSDSTIYMTFYTIYHILSGNGAEPVNLTDKFFDFVIGGEGELSDVAEASNIDEPTIKRCRESFLYWYRFTSRHSGSDLVYNHLVMYIFNHVAVLPEGMWPKQIVTNGLLEYGGQKMSKSMGNIIPLKDGVQKYGADPLKMVIVASVEIDAESDFSESLVAAVNSRVDFLVSQAIDTATINNGRELRALDFWLYSRLNSKIANAVRHMDEIMLKSAYDEIFFASVGELKRYKELGGANGLAVSDYLSAAVKMLSPIMPHVGEELWHLLGNKTLVATEKWPEADEGMVNKELEECFGIFDATEQDINKAIELTQKMEANRGRKVKSVRIIMAEEWKAEAYNMLASGKQISEIISAVGGKVDKENAARYLQGFKNRKEITKEVLAQQQTLYNTFSEMKGYLKKKFNCDVEVEKEGSSNSPRAQRAQPGKPSIEVVWA